MPAMIDYAVLCRAIEDWKAGHAPQIPAHHPPSSPVSAPSAAAETGYETMDAEGVEPEPEDRTIIYQMPEIVDDEG